MLARDNDGSQLLVIRMPRVARHHPGSPDRKDVRILPVWEKSSLAAEPSVCAVHVEAASPVACTPEQDPRQERLGMSRTVWIHRLQMAFYTMMACSCFLHNSIELFAERRQCLASPSFLVTRGK